MLTNTGRKLHGKPPALMTTCDPMDPSLGQPENLPDQKETPFLIAWPSVGIVPANTQKPSWDSMCCLPFPSYFIVSYELSKTF